MEANLPAHPHLLVCLAIIRLDMRDSIKSLELEHDMRQLSPESYGKPGDCFKSTVVVREPRDDPGRNNQTMRLITSSGSASPACGTDFAIFDDSKTFTRLDCYTTTQLYGEIATLVPPPFGKSALIEALTVTYVDISSSETTVSPTPSVTTISTSTAITTPDPTTTSPEPRPTPVS